MQYIIAANVTRDEVLLLVAKAEAYQETTEQTNVLDRAKEIALEMKEAIYSITSSVTIAKETLETTWTD